VLQRAANLTPPITWVPVLTNTSDANGKWTFTDTSLTNSAGSFYRLAAP
jgi:hypothetical protein